MSIKKILLCLSAIPLTAIIILLLSTVRFNHNNTDSNPNELKKLTSVCKEMTQHILSSDGISCNFNIKNPEIYLGNTRPDSLGSLNSYSYSQENALYENMLLKLNNINTSLLNNKDLLTYKILKESLSLTLELGKYPMLLEPLSPISGIHTQLPILLGEYHFYDESYIETYFSILQSVPEYFSQILNFEKEKAAHSMFMSNELATKVIAQCRDFIAKPIHNHLIASFDEHVVSLYNSGILSKEAYDSYSITNKNIILNDVIPAYEALISGLESLMQYCTPAKGLSHNSGKNYYVKLFRQQTCSAIPPEKAFKLFKKTLKECLNISNDITTYKPLTSTDNSPYDMVASLKQIMQKSYPPLPTDSQLTIKNVPKSLEASLSPAMYLTPPIDDFQSDTIYINNASCDFDSLYTTLAHEAFPGHMYQIRYFHSQNSEPVRLLLNMAGYAEGWATYAELDILDSLGYDSDTATLLKCSKLANLCMYSIMDIGIHYYGWELYDVADFLDENGFNDITAAREIYNDIVYEPAVYSKYALGCIELMSMKHYAMKRDGDKFNPVEFHKIILETGPIWFEELWKIIKHEKP